MIYLEVFIAENILINYLIIYLSQRFLNVQIRHLKIFIAACVGTVYGYFQLTLPFEFLSEFYFKILVSVSMCFCAYGITNLKHKIKEIFALYFFTSVLGGAAYSFINIFGGKITDKGIAVESSEFIYLLLSIFIVCLCFDVFFAYRKKRSHFDKLLYSVKIINKNKSVKLRAFLDTGNNITDKEGDSICILEKIYAKKLFYDDAEEGYITFKTVTGIGVMPYFKADEIVIEGERNIHNVKIALYNGKLSKENRYSVLLSPAYFLEENYEDQPVKIII